MSKLVGVACLAVFGFAAGLAYYFLVIEAQKKSQKKTNGEATKVELEPIKEDEPPCNETSEVDAVIDPVGTESPMSLDSYEVTSLPASENILTDSLVIIDKHDIEEDQNNLKHEIIDNVHGAISLEEELNAAQSALVQNEPKESSAGTTKDDSKQETMEQSPGTDQGNDKEDSGEVSEEEDVVSVVEASQNKAEESPAVTDKDDSQATREVVEEVSEVVASTIPLELSPEDLPLEKEPSEDPVEVEHGKNLEVDAEEEPPFSPSVNDVIHAESEQSTAESPKPVQEKIEYNDNFTEQDRKLSEVFVQPVNLHKEDDVDVASVQATADSDDEDIAGIKALDESDNDGIASEKSDVNGTVADSKNGEVSDNNGVKEFEVEDASGRALPEAEDDDVAGIKALEDSQDEDAAIFDTESDKTESNNFEVSDNKAVQEPEVEDGEDKAAVDSEDDEAAGSKTESEDDVAGIKSLAESEDEVPEESPETNGKSSSSDEKAVVDDNIVTKKGKKRNKRRNKRKANGALVDDANVDATRF